MTRVDVAVPSYGMTDAEVYIARWAVATGDTVASGQEMVEVETNKAEAVIEAPAAGVVGDLLVTEDSEVAPGTILTWIESEES